MACEAGADVRGDHHQAEEILLLHYADIIRVNNVRNAWKSTPRPGGQRQLFDRSLWESVQRKDPEGLRKPDRGSMAHASVVCVLVGTETWARPWVGYEIARSVIDKRGLLAVHINSLQHHQRSPRCAWRQPAGLHGRGAPEPGGRDRPGRQSKRGQR